MKSIFNIWMQPVHARMNLHGIRSLVILLLSIPLIVEVAVFCLSLLKNSAVDFKVYWYALLISLGGMVGLLFYGWFILLSMNISLQYSPSNAKLIPGLKHKLQLSLVIPILFVSACSTIVFGLVAQKWSLFPFLATTIFLSFFIVTIRNQWAVIPFVLTFQIAGYFETNGAINPLQLVESSIGVPIEVLYFLLSIFILALTQAWLFAVRDEAHFKMYQRAQLVKGGLQYQNTKESSFTLGFAVIYFQMMKHQVKKMLMVGAGFKRSKLAMYVFGPRIHWSTLLLQVSAMGISIVVFMRLTSLFVDKKSDFWEGFGQGFGMGFVGIYLVAQPVVFLVQMFYKIYQTRSEQALVCLTPYAGSRAEIDRELLNYCFRQFGIFYCLSVFSVIFFLIKLQTIDLKCAALVLTVTSVFPCILAIPTAFSEMRSQNDHPIAWSCLPGGILLVLGLSSFVFIPFQAVWFYPLIVIPTTMYFLNRKIREFRERTQFPAGCVV